MRQRLVLQILVGMGLLTILMILTTPIAFADNCGSLLDCLHTTDSATAVTVGIAVLIAVAALALPSLLDATKSGSVDIPPGHTGAPEPGQAPGDFPPSGQEVQGTEHAGSWQFQDRGAMPEHVGYPQQGEHGGTLEHAGSPQFQDRAATPEHAGHGAAAEVTDRLRLSPEHPGHAVEHPEQQHHPRETEPTLHHPGQHHPVQHRPGEHVPDHQGQPSEMGQTFQEQHEMPSPRLMGSGQEGLRTSLEQESQVVRAPQEAQIIRPGPEVQAVRSEAEARFQNPVEPLVEPLVAGPITGLHHVTAITSNPQQNIDFYTGVLGLRLVKLTVNFDNPSTYQLYYGDELGRPGTIVSFFAWPGAPRGSRGTGQATAIAFSIPEGTLDQWQEYLTRVGLNVVRPPARFDEQMLTFFDPDGIQIELVAHHDAGMRGGYGWAGGPIPATSAIRGLYGVTLSEAGYERTHALLTQVLAFRPVGAVGNRFRYEIGLGGPGALLDVLNLPSVPNSQPAVGTIDHIGWRTAEDEQLQSVQQRLVSFGFAAPALIDRYYFHTFPLREPGGVLFVFATDQPGFTRDEPPEQLGTRLILPPWLEARRSELEQALPPLRLPSARSR